MKIRPAVLWACLTGFVVGAIGSQMGIPLSVVWPLAFIIGVWFGRYGE